MEELINQEFLARLDAAKEADENRIALLERYLTPIAKGKVRHLFEVPGKPDLMAVYVSDRWSARDFLFGFVIPGKGKYLNISTVAVKRILRKVRGYNILTDLVAYGRVIDEHLPVALRHDRELWQRVTIVRKCEMIPCEVVLRNHLYGTAWGEYNDPSNVNHMVAGQELPGDLPLFAGFDSPLQTPTTKAHIGHDQSLTVQEVEAAYPGLLSMGAQTLEALNGYLLEDAVGRCVDIKFEFGRDTSGNYVLCDEVSPDSSRLCLVTDYMDLAPGQVPSFFDKEFGRAWGDRKGLKDLDPTSSDDRGLVASWRPDSAFVEEMLRRYGVAFHLLSRGHTLAEYKRDAMSI